MTSCREAIRKHRSCFRPHIFLAQAVSILAVALTSLGFAAEVHGSVYEDTNLNRSLDSGEGWSNGTQVFVNLVGAVVTSVEVTNTNGEFSFTNVLSGNYSLVVTTGSLAATPAEPSGWAFVYPTGGERSITLAQDDVLLDQDFGLHQGSRLSGVFFRDDGTGTGVPNDALLDSTEQKLPGVMLSVTDGASTRKARSAGDGSYELFLPSSWSSPVNLTHDAGPTTGVNDGASVLQTPSSYSEATSFSTTVDISTGGSHTRNFGLVRETTFGSDNSGAAPSPGSVGFIHLLRPGTTGTLTFTSQGDHSYDVFVDEDCDGEVAPDERKPTPSFTIGSEWPRSVNGVLDACPVMVRVLVPEGIAEGRIDIAEITAHLGWENLAAVTDEASVTNVTTVMTSTELTLEANVRNVTTGGKEDDRLSKGKPGETLEYCASYRNVSTRAIDSVEVSIPVPLLTEFAYGVYDEGADVTWDDDGEDKLLTAAADTDEAELSGNLLVLDVGSLAPNTFGRVCFSAVIR